MEVQVAEEATVESVVLNFLLKEFLPENPTNPRVITVEDILSDLGLDSFGRTELITECERTFRITILEADVRNMRVRNSCTVRELIKLLEECVARQ